MAPGCQTDSMGWPRMICPETQGKLEDLRPHDGPVRLYVWHVIEQEPGCCECLEIINRSRFLFATSVGGRRPMHTHKRNLTGTRILLEISHQLQGVDSLLKGLGI